MPFKVAIIGAGPVGCLLARLLTQASISCTIYELEPSPSFRRQGGSLDLHDDTGLVALQAAGLFEEFKKHARYDSQYLAICDETTKKHMILGDDRGKKLQERPEIDRVLLRKILIESLPEETIKWGYKVTSVEETPEGRKLSFANGETITDFDYLVGAEGAWSKVRTLLSPVKPRFAGLGYILTVIPPGGNQWVAEFINKGACFVHVDGRYNLTLMQLGDGSTNLAFYWMEEDPEWFLPGHTEGVDASDPESLRAFILSKMEGWNENLLEAVRSSKGDVQPKSLFELPTDFQWEHKEGVTIIGDAAHLMTPFAGEGVNVGFEDALGLSKAIISGVQASEDDKSIRQSVDTQVAAFEKVMIPRMHRYMLLTQDMKDGRFSPGRHTSEIVVIMAQTAAKFRTPTYLAPVVSSVVRGYFMGRNAVEWAGSWFSK